MIALHRGCSGKPLVATLTVYLVLYSLVRPSIWALPLVHHLILRRPPIVHPPKTASHELPKSSLTPLRVIRPRWRLHPSLQRRHFLLRCLACHRSLYSTSHKFLRTSASASALKSGRILAAISSTCSLDREAPKGHSNVGAGPLALATVCTAFR